MTNELQPMTGNRALDAAGGEDFARLVDLIAPEHGAGMVAASSARVYRHTFTEWARYALERGGSPLAVNYETVREFLNDNPASKATQQRRLSALRTLAKVRAVFNPGDPMAAAAYETVKLLKVAHAPTASAAPKQERQRRALTPAEADRLLRWCADQAANAGEGEQVKALRDRAIVSTMLLTGLRRAELAALEWRDIDFTNGVIAVRHGKGDKPRDPAIFSGAALDALKAWQLEQPRGYRFVFVGLRRGGTFTGDRPMDVSAIWRVVATAAEAAGIGHLAPHDLRRTLATELIATGMTIPDVQAQLGHENASTTMIYAQSVDARQRRKAGRVRYG